MILSKCFRHTTTAVCRQRMTATTVGIFPHQPQQGSRNMSISRMLDMGGAPSAMNDKTMIRTVNASKNSKLQAVAFDFEILTNSLEKAKHDKEVLEESSSRPDTKVKLAPVQPDLDQIQQVASLLNVSIDTGKQQEPSATKSKQQGEFKATDHQQDVRAKYAAKLKGGLAGIELAKQQVDDKLKGGDAAGHLAVRKMVIQETAASPTKWMALTGTGKLLSYLTHRCIRIALLPNPSLPAERSKRQQQMMLDFKNQLKDVVVDSVVSLDDKEGEETSKEQLLSKALQGQVAGELDIHPNRILVVSDRDDILKAGKDLGMLTCRLRPLNARRGNVSAHYNTTTVPGVQEVVNEINGVSFSAVLNR